jgi:hypothetical protein
VRVEKIVTTQLLGDGVVGTPVLVGFGAGEETSLGFALEEDGKSRTKRLPGSKHVGVRKGAQSKLLRLTAAWLNPLALRIDVVRAQRDGELPELSRVSLHIIIHRYVETSISSLAESDHPVLSLSIYSS